MAASWLWLKALVFLVLALKLAEARPGRPFYPCGSNYVVALSFSLSRPEPHESALVVARFEGNNPELPFPRPMPLPLGFHRWGFMPHGGFRPHSFPVNPMERPVAVRRETVGSGSGSGSGSGNGSGSGDDNTWFGLSSSFYRRAEDVLSILTALLLGALTGAVTASLVYALWSIVSHGCGADSDDIRGNEDFVGPNFGYEKLASKNAKEEEAIKVKVKDAVKA